MPENRSDPVASGSIITRKRIKLKDLDSICNSGTSTRKDHDSLEFKGATVNCCSNKERKKASASASDIPSHCSGSHDDGDPVQHENVDSSIHLSCSFGAEVKIQAISPGRNALSLLGEAACASLTQAERPLAQESKGNMASVPAETAPEKVSNEPGSKQSLLGTGEQCSKSSKFINVDLTLSPPIAFQGVINDINVMSGNPQLEMVPRRYQDQLDFEGTWNYLKTKKGFDTDDKASECGSSTGPLEESTSLRVWKEMKQNGFLSSQPHAPLHKKVYLSRPPRSKRKRDLLKKNIELAKREQVNRFTRIAAPSGLLTGLNPGIINHVKNSKQVQSIIEALVKSEKLDNSPTQKGVFNQSSSETESQEINEEEKEREGISNLDTDGASLSDNSSAVLLGSDGHAPPKFLPKVQPKGHGGISSCLWLKDSKTIQQETTDLINRTEALVSSQHGLEVGNAELSLMLPKGLITSENPSLLCSEEISTNQDCLNGLSVKAALVAHQWLELLCQDIKGRLAALGRSKKRIQTIIRNELPLIMFGDFSPNQKNEQCGGLSAGDIPDNRLPDNHLTRWRSLFYQMDLALQQEGKQLESWLRQVKEMQAHCDRGLNGMNMKKSDSLSENSSRSKKRDNMDDEFAVRATAASIYSTCSFAMSIKNISCF